MCLFINLLCWRGHNPYRQHTFASTCLRNALQQLNTRRHSSRSPLKKMRNGVVMTTCYSDGIKWLHTQGKCKSDWLCIMHPEWRARSRWECWWAQDEFPLKRTHCSVSHIIFPLFASHRQMGLIFPNPFCLCIFCRCRAREDWLHLDHAPRHKVSCSGDASHWHHG